MSKVNPESIIIEPYDPTWPQQAEQEIAMLKDCCAFPWVMDIQHVGSTAVPELNAKPIIDIMIGVKNINEARALIPLLETMGYIFWDKNPKPNHLVFIKGMPPYGKKRTHHVHVFKMDSYEWLIHHVFRDYLRMHQNTKVAYQQLKEELAEKFKDDREAYTAAKAEFIKSILQSAAKKLITFTSLSKVDFPLVYNWFNEPHVQEFYSLRSWTLDEVTKKLAPYIDGSKKVNGFICHIDKKAIGYIQYYNLADYPIPDQDIAQDVVIKAAGIDFFIGDKGFLKKGLAGIILEEFLHQQIWPHYQYCIVDPDIRNQRSIDFFAKHGFKKHKIIVTKDVLQREVKLQLMIRKN
jgi:GrpB-like predicted nucleotidyltransferase (UPF0157 family)